MVELFDAWTMEGGYPSFSENEYLGLLGLASRLRGGPCHVLDIGCGVGLVSRVTKGMGHRVVGLDINRNALEVALRHHRIDEAAEGDALATGLPSGRFDVIQCFSVLLYVFDLPSFFKEAERLLTPGGQILIVDHHAGNPYAKLHFWRPNWVDVLVEGRSNIKRRPLTAELIRNNSPRAIHWAPPAYTSLFTHHPNKMINFVHDIVRIGFQVVRKFSTAPWTGNLIAMVGTKQG